MGVWMDVGGVGNRVRQWMLGAWSSLFSRSGHLDAVTCDAPLTWVGSPVSSILAMEPKLTACSVVVDILF